MNNAPALIPTTQNQPLRITNFSQVTIEIEPDAPSIAWELLSKADEVSKVTTPEELAAASVAIREIRTFTKAIVAAGKNAKATFKPINDRIDSEVVKLTEDLVKADVRLTNDVNAYQTAERQKAEKAEQARLAEIRRVELERQALEVAAQKAKREAEAASFISNMAETKAVEEVKKIETAIATVAATPLPAVYSAPPKVEGVATQDVWQFAVEDLHKLYAHDKSLVRIEANVSAIQRAIKATVGDEKKIPGLRIWKESKSSFRTIN